MLFTHVINDGYSFYAVTDDGALHWYRDLRGDGTNAPDGGSGDWAQNSGHQIGSGWNEYSRIFAGSDPGVIYAQKPTGELFWYRDTLRDGSNNPSGSSGWDQHSGRHIGDGWHQYSHVFCGNNGVIYAIKPTGELEWFKDLGKLVSIGPGQVTRWANGGVGKQIGSGWNEFSHVVFSNLWVPGHPTLSSTAALYGIKPTGEILYYLDLRQDGSNIVVPGGWGGGSGNQIGIGWNVFQKIIGAPSGVLYCIKPTGELLWYQDVARDGSNAPNGSSGWAERSGSQIGVGWYIYPSSLPPSIQFDFDNVAFDDNTPVGGNAHLTLRSDGTFTFWGNIHNSGFIDYDVSLMTLVKDTDEHGYTCQISGLTGGSASSSSRNLTFRADSQDDSIREAWPKIVAKNFSICKIRADSNLTSLTNDIEQAAGLILAIIALPVVWAFLGGGQAQGTSSNPTQPAPPLAPPPGAGQD